MRATKIKIRNLFGISETELDGRSIEVTGDNGKGKTSIIDAIRYALTNTSNREYIVKNGESEGEIIVETDTGLCIDRRKRTNQSDYKSVKENGKETSSPESLLRSLFTPLQLDPVEFTQMSKNEQNRIILDLIEFDWDLNWIKEKFGEIPEGVNYEQNILQVLNDIQAENGKYFQERQDINREIRNRKAFIEDIAKGLHDDYHAEVWEDYELGETYKKIAEIKKNNDVIERAKAFVENYDNKIRGLQAEKEIKVSGIEKEVSNERTMLVSSIEKMKAEINAAEDKLKTLEDRQNDKIKVVESEYKEKVAKLGADIETAMQYADKPIIDCSDLEDEASEAEEMIKHLKEYDRMKKMDEELKKLIKASDELTRKIELARRLPGEILQTATIPIEGFSVKDGIPLINGLPVSNLSEGEQLSLCVDVALSKPNSLQIILIDGAEKLSDSNREKLYEKCKEKGLQFIATRTTNGELEVNYI